MSGPCSDSLPRWLLTVRAGLTGALLVCGLPAMAATDDTAAVIEPSAGTDTGLSVSDAWVRAVPPNARTTAGYFVLHNNGQTAWRIRSVSADVAGAAELHRWREQDGVKTMVRQTGLTVAPGEKLSLAPGGLHMMLFRLDPVPAPGASVRICVQLAYQAQQSEKPQPDDYCFPAEVRRP